LRGLASNVAVLKGLNNSQKEIEIVVIRLNQEIELLVGAIWFSQKRLIVHY